MICTDAVLLHTPIVIFDFGISSPHPNVWYRPMIVMEKIQVIGFSIQETIISVLYIYHASGFLKDVYTRQTHRVMHLLIFAQVTAIVFDICLITVDCNNMFTLKIIIHPFAYAIKLKMEFIVLNQLLALIKHGFAPGSFPAPDEESPDISGPTPVRSDLLSQTEKTAPDSNVIVRDMEPHVSVASAEQTSPDVILPTVHPPAILTTERTEARPTTIREEDEEPHMPLRSFSDPMPLNLDQREQDSEAIVLEMERRYLGRYGMDLPR
jgi:hypothetical protein